MHRFLALIAAAAVAVPTASALAAPKPPPSGAPTIKAAPALVVAGASTTLSGKVPGAKAGTAVALQRDPFPLGDGWLAYRTATTGKGGAYSFTVPPFIATSYRAVAGTAASPGTTVRVRPSVGLTLARSGALTRFSGSVHPARGGARVSIQRRSAADTWTTVSRVTLTDAGTTRSRTRCGCRCAPPPPTTSASPPSPATSPPRAASARSPRASLPAPGG